MLDWVLNTPLAGNVRKKKFVEKKIEEILTSLFEPLGKKIVIVFRDVFKTKLNTYDDDFLRK